MTTNVEAAVLVVVALVVTGALVGALSLAVISLLALAEWVDDGREV